jgi:hypothetical protein
LYSAAGISSCKNSGGFLFAYPSAIALKLPESGLPSARKLLQYGKDIEEGLPVIVLGKLSTRWPLWIYRANGGGFRGNGFGSQGQYPYLLDVKEIKVETHTYK